MLFRSKKALVPFFHGNLNLSVSVYFSRATSAFFAFSSALYAFLIVSSVASSFSATALAFSSADANVSQPSEYRFSFSFAD